MLLPKEDNVNTGKHGLGFENKSDDENTSLLNKTKALAPFLYNIDEMGKELISDHKIISEEELKAELLEQRFSTIMGYRKKMWSGSYGAKEEDMANFKTKRWNCGACKQLVGEGG
ncbi:hypothetical protein Tco_1346307, partial [Tanacetum coccineum]